MLAMSPDNKSVTNSEDIPFFSTKSSKVLISLEATLTFSLHLLINNLVNALEPY